MQVFRSPHQAHALHRPLPAGEASAETTLIADRAEFIDALARLRRGRLLAHSAEESDERCIIDGQMLYTSLKPLSQFGLLDELPPSPRQGKIHCYKLSPRGRHFADQAWREWKARPLWQRLVVRLMG